MAHDLATWLKFTEKLLQIGYALFNGRQFPITGKGASDPSVLVITLLARSISNLRGVVLLVREGLVVEARTLVRCIFENLFRVGGLVTEGDAFAKEMFQDELTSRKLRGKIVLDRPMEDNRRLRSFKLSQIVQDFCDLQESSLLALNFLARPIKYWRHR